MNCQDSGFKKCFTDLSFLIFWKKAYCFTSKDDHNFTWQHHTGSTTQTRLGERSPNIRPWQTRTHCCRHKCFPVCPHAQHLLRTQIFCVRDTKNVSDFVQKHFVSATNVSQFAKPKKRHGQQCVRNNVSSFTRAYNLERTLSYIADVKS